MDLHKQLNNIAFEALFNHATIGIVTVDERGVIILVNPYALVQFGYEREELIGQRVEMLIPMRYAHKHEGIRDNFTKHPQNRPMGIGRDLFAKRKDNSEFPVEISLSNYKVNDHTYVIAFVIDITVRKENEYSIAEQQKEKEIISQELKVLNEQLERKVEDRTMMLKETLNELEKSRDELTDALEKEKELNDLKTRFVSMASHEFKTPLSAILSSVSLIDKYQDPEEKQKRDKHIQRIKSQVRNLTNILEEFLSLGRFEEGLILEKKENFNIREMVTELCSEMGGSAKEGQAVSVSYEGDESVNMDKNLLRNVLVNLISNAIKYSPEKSKIKLSISNNRDHTIIAIEDKGIGISEEDLKHMTDRFFRGDNAMNIQGTGLGLHIVKKYLEVMGGDMRFESKLNHGTKVILNFNHKS